MLALIMLMLALGLIFLFKFGPPLPTFLMLIVAAIFFVLAASFFERYEVGSIMWGFLAAVIGTGMIVLISGGVRYLLDSSEMEMVEVSTEELISGMALCIIASMVLLNYLKRSLDEIEEY